MCDACGVPLPRVVYISTLSGAFGAENHVSPNHRIGQPRSTGDGWDDGDEDELDRPGDEVLDPEDPDWGFDDEETLPEYGDFWLDSDDVEEPL